jgi:hypothetical protein
MTNQVNVLFRVNNERGCAYIAINENNADEFETLINQIDGAKISRYSINNVKLNELPENIQNEVMGILKVYNKVSVIFQNGEFHVRIGCCICAQYPKDHFVCGDYLATDVYSKEQQERNFIESF